MGNKREISPEDKRAFEENAKRELEFLRNTDAGKQMQDRLKNEAHAREVIEELSLTTAGRKMEKQSLPKAGESGDERMAGAAIKNETSDLDESPELRDPWKYVGIIEGMEKELWSPESAQLIQDLQDMYGEKNILRKERSDGKTWVFVHRDVL